MGSKPRPTAPVATLAKFSRPRLFNVQKRERLFRLLDERRAHPILWIAGPPGSGKSTLVASYVEARKLPGVWFQADPGDADPATFFHYLRTAAADLSPRRAKHAAALPVFTGDYAGDLPAFTRRFLREFFALFPAGALLADWASAPFDRPAGDLLGCLNAVAAGCGHGANCGECPVREAIRRATDGLRVERQPVAMHLVRGGSVQRVELRLTAAPVSRGGERLALVVLEPSEWVR